MAKWSYADRPTAPASHAPSINSHLHRKLYRLFWDRVSDNWCALVVPQRLALVAHDLRAARGGGRMKAAHLNDHAAAEARQPRNSISSGGRMSTLSTHCRPYVMCCGISVRSIFLCVLSWILWLMEFERSRRPSRHRILERGTFRLQSIANTAARGFNQPSAEIQPNGPRRTLEQRLSHLRTP